MDQNERTARLASLRKALRTEIHATCALLELHAPAHLDEWNEAALIAKVVDLRAAQHHYARMLMQPQGARG